MVITKGSLALLAGLMLAGTLTGQSLDRAGVGNETTASRITLGSNLFVDPCTGCYYNSNPSGYAVIGPDNCDFPDQVEQLAVPFIAAATGAPSSIEASLILYNPSECPENEVTLSINTDLCYPVGPGQVLASGRATVPLASCDLAVAKLRNAPTLTQGTKYWVVAKSAGSSQASLEARWYSSNNAPVAENYGAGWLASPGGAPAFRVVGQGTETLAIGGIAAQKSLDARPAFGSNLLLDPCSGCNYDPNAIGLPVRGPQNCTSSGRTYWLAVPFIAHASGVPKRISASLVLYKPTECPEDKVTLSLYTDNCDGLPGALLVSAIATVPAEVCNLAVARLRNAPPLEKGKKYWVAATTDATQSGLDAHWYGSNNAQLGINLGDGWTQFSDNTPAFIVQ